MAIISILLLAWRTEAKSSRVRCEGKIHQSFSVSQMISIMTMYAGTALLSLHCCDTQCLWIACCRRTPLWR